MESKRQWIATNRLKTTARFRALFPGKQSLTNAISEHMRQNGYDESQPIIVWDRSKEQGRNALYVVDGHTRLVAAKLIGLSPIYVARMKFDDENAALEYAIHAQRDRRNLSDADLFRYIEAIDQKKPRGGDRKSKASIDANDSVEIILAAKRNKVPLAEIAPTLGISQERVQRLESRAKSAAETAKIVGTSQAKVERARTVLKHADEATKGAVLSGKKSIHKAYQETQKRRKPKPDKPVSDKNKKTPLADMDDFIELQQIYENFLNKLIGFDVNHREKKKLRKEYLPILSGWAGNLKALIDNWTK